MAGTVVIDHAALERLAAPGGPVAVWLAGKAAEVAATAAGLAPHRSGALAASIAVTPLQGPLAGFSVGSPLPYAHYIHDRTPFLTDALAEVLGR